jgi:hypothetical protein
MIIEEHGEGKGFFCDHANVPVNIWIGRVEEDEGHPVPVGTWYLHFQNYMPRKDTVYLAPNEDWATIIYATERADLETIIRKQIKPLYLKAVANIDAMLEGKGEALYYWD